MKEQDAKDGGKPKDSLKRSDQIALMRAALHRERTGEWNDLFTYPNCGYDLVRSGLATEKGVLTIAGCAALYLLGDEDADPTADSKSFQTLAL